MGVVKRGTALFLFLALCFSSFPIYALEGIVRSGKETGEKRIALTFDDGPCEKYDPEILDVLDKYGVSATFFLVGENIERVPLSAKRIADRGHEIGNHTYSHKRPGKLSAPELCGEIARTKSLIERVCGCTPLLFRPPEGFVNELVRDVASSGGYTLVLWSIDTLDWKGREAKDIVDTVMKEAKDGAIILCHDYIWKKSETAKAINEFIPALQKMGYKFVTVGELLED
jgi:peptidoglycan/xylan/chitin deacetylase (PgdA/CDA1 family)